MAEEEQWEAHVHEASAYREQSATEELEAKDEARNCVYLVGRSSVTAKTSDAPAKCAVKN